MKSRFKVGAEIDFVSTEEFNAGVGRLEKALTDLKERPVTRMRVYGKGTVPASGTVTITIPGPAMGRQWNVRQIRVCGPAQAVINGHATIYRGDVQPSLYVDSTNKAGNTSASGLPNLSDAGTNERIFAQGEAIIVVITGGTNGDLVSVNADVIDEPLSKFEDIGGTEETA